MSADAEGWLRGERYTTINGDAYDLVGSFEVDSIITDPPYGEQTHEGARTLWGTGKRWRNEKGRERAKAIAINFDALSDYEIAPRMCRSARRWVLAFCELEQLGIYKAAAGESWVRACVWHRTDGTPQLSGDRPAQAAEGIAVMRGNAAGRMKWNGGGQRGLWSYGVEREDRVHPTQKPLDLMLRLVELFTDSGEIILDPFMGSGTTGVAALRLGRRFIGIEKDPKYAAIARERLEAESRGLTLRDARLGQRGLFEGLPTPPKPAEPPPEPADSNTLPPEIWTADDEADAFPEATP